MKKPTIIIASLFSIIALTACETTQPQPESDISIKTNPITNSTKAEINNPQLNSENTSSNQENQSNQKISQNQCLIGKWEVKNIDKFIEAYLKEIFAEKGLSTNNIAINSTGKLFLEFTEDQMSMNEEKLVIDAKVMGVNQKIAINADGKAKYESNNGNIKTTLEKLNVNQNNGIGISMNSFVGENISYQCEGDNTKWIVKDAPVVIDLKRVQ